MSLHQLYAGREAYYLPVYSVREAAHLTGISPTTVREWSRIGPRPLVDKAGPGGALSFLNLVELYVLASIRHQHQVPLERVRQALDYVRRQWGKESPLAKQQFETDGADLFVRALNNELLINASRHGQVAIEEVMGAYLQRIERASDGFPLRLFPLYRSHADTVDEVRQAPALIAVDPALSFGRPVLVQANIPVDVVLSRYRAGDSISELAEDFCLPIPHIEEAIRYQLGHAA